MKATIRFYMKNRKEYEFVIEGDGQTDWYNHGFEKLALELMTFYPTENDKGWNEIERWIITPVEGIDDLSVDKQDSVTIRSPFQKVRIDLIPISPLVQIAQVFTFGSFHYGDRNWENGFSYSRCIGAAFRHFLKWCMGEDLDSESGLSHLAHACANLIFLMEYQTRGTGKDDRVAYNLSQYNDAFRTINCEKRKK